MKQMSTSVSHFSEMDLDIRFIIFFFSYGTDVEIHLRKL